MARSIGRLAAPPASAARSRPAHNAGSRGGGSRLQQAAAARAQHRCGVVFIPACTSTGSAKRGAAAMGENGERFAAAALRAHIVTVREAYETYAGSI